MKQKYLDYLKKRYRCKLWDFLFSDNSKLIYGKGVQAEKVYEICRLLGIHIEGFVSTTEEVFAGSVENEKNYTIENLPETYAEADILIAVNEKWNDEITNALVKKGFSHICTVPEWTPINGLFQTRFFRYMVLQENNNPTDYESGIIRFCNGFEEQIKLAEYTGQSLLEKICNEKLENVLFHVYDGEGLWQGMIEFSDLIISDEDWTLNLNQQKIRFDSSVFDRCNDFFARYPWRMFVPVYWHDGTVACMAWLEKPESRGVFESQMRTLNTLKTLKKEDVSSFLMDIDEVYLHGVNEMSYQLYLLLKEKQIPYHIEGKFWRLLGDAAYKEEINKIESEMDYRQLNVYAESQTIFPLNKADEKFYNREKVFWNYEWLNTLSKMVCVKISEQMIQKLRQHGVTAFLITFPESQHFQKMTEEEIYDIHHDTYLHYISKMIDVCGNRFTKIYQAETIEKYLAGKQCEGRFYKSRQNLTEWSITEEERRNNIYIIGSCVAAQTDLSTEHTILAQLQKRVEAEYPGQYKVSAISVDMQVHFSLIEKIVNSIDFWEGDICLFFFNMTSYRSQYEISLDCLYDTRRERWFSNAPIHLNEIGSEKVAEYIFESCVKPNIGARSDGQIGLYASSLDVNEQKGITLYVDKYRNFVKKGEKCGCIVMNCNPYTYGHDYLIAKASRQVDWLYIFVVEEDRSYFSFADRIELVRKSTEKYNNVIVLPSGKMILSAETMPSYFMKETHQEIKVDAAKDLRIFGLGIAPAFGITIRFAGEEPIDKVTEQYNREMKKRLPHYGIEFVEIPRIQLKGGKAGSQIISASKVRELFKERDWEKIKEYVPEYTWNYLAGLVSVSRRKSLDSGQ